MERRGECVEAEPVDCLEFVRFAVFYFIFINEHLEIECEPMGFCAIVFAMHVAESQEVVCQYIRAVLFFYFFMKRLFDGVMELKSAPARVPCTVLIAAICAALAQEKISVAVVAEKDNANSSEIGSFLHKKSIVCNRKKKNSPVRGVFLFSATTQAMRRL